MNRAMETAGPMTDRDETDKEKAKGGKYRLEV